MKVKYEANISSVAKTHISFATQNKWGYFKQINVTVMIQYAGWIRGSSKVTDNDNIHFLKPLLTDRWSGGLKPALTEVNFINLSPIY